VTEPPKEYPLSGELRIVILRARTFARDFGNVEVCCAHVLYELINADNIVSFITKKLQGDSDLRSLLLVIKKSLIEPLYVERTGNNVPYSSEWLHALFEASRNAEDHGFAETGCDHAFRAIYENEVGVASLLENLVLPLEKYEHEFDMIMTFKG
jgi:hypothetical protein